MNNTGVILRQNHFSALAILVISLMALFGLSSCGGGGSDSDPEPTPDQDASGLFKDGTATLNPGAGELSITDLRAFVHDGRIIAFSIAEHILFDGQVDSISGSDFTATVDLYEAGERTQGDISVTGSVTSQSSITGTLGGTDVGSGDFTLTFDLAYGDGATIEKIRDKPSNWEGHILSTYSFLNDSEINWDAFDVFNVDELVGSVLDSDSVDICSYLGSISIPNNSSNLYIVEFDIPSGFGVNDGQCDLPLDPVIKYSGFASVLSESSAENDLLFASTNGSFAIFGLLTIIP